MTVIGELSLIFGICLISVGIEAILPFSFPASVLSMIFLLALLLSGIIKERHISRVSHFLIGNMAFFFLPSCVGLLEHWETLSSCLFPFLLISLVTTPLVYCSVGWTIQLMMKAKIRRREHRG